MLLIGKTEDEETVTGTINIPEVAHDTEEDEYVVGSLTPVLIFNACCMYRR
jgi:hypothetical protein